ncbi:PstS family phosphate ABC transporter substrate-binding protein [Parachryseolinea silvisoli]|jgi:phosphate transport system substrate-binding protein|uniref:PstS family phosphate ABC transporter substrate-binding protein n=1 Tax=Parachryseolinea silvisoli TaxID=2873601 RepID=UPI002265F133|nr:substrate-binding domain-containing protein [Parachryseolinea silvisoli]MCD9015010.1 substrate-binding domain-containing protein [Parachryseolinea silvisoli]
MKILFHSLLITLCLLAACTGRDKKGRPLDTPTSGSIRIAVDESLKPLLDTEVDTFTGLYQRAHIEVTYASEQEAIRQLLLDSVRLVVITRKLLPEEIETLAQQALKPHQVTVAREGIALVMNRTRTDSVLSVEQLGKMLKGDIANWSQLSPKGPAGPLEIVFDQPTSGILRYLKDSLKIDTLPKNCFAVNDNPSVIQHVASRPNAIGLIGGTWISDSDDSTANAFLNTVRIAALSRQTGGESFQPFQAYIAQNKYPLIREITVVSREGRTGLGSGLLAFIAGEKGQRIVLKSGLVPVTMPIRIVEINRQPLN